MDEQERIRRNIVALMNSYGNVKKFSERTGMKSSTIYKWTAGQRMPSTALAQKLAKYSKGKFKVLDLTLHENR